MQDKNKHITYWVNSAEDDMKTAQILIHEKRFLHGLFFCHLVIEKTIKAHYVNKKNEIPPKTHNLIYLSEKSGLIFEDETLIFLGILMKYQLQGRYPDYDPIIPDHKVIDEYLKKTENLLEWLKKKL